MWRETGRTLTFFGIDGRAMFVLLVWLYHPRMWTVVGGLLFFTLLMLLNRKGYSVPNAIRRSRVLITGNVKSAVAGRRKGRSDR